MQRSFLRGNQIYPIYTFVGYGIFRVSIAPNHRQIYSNLSVVYSSTRPPCTHHYFGTVCYGQTRDHRYPNPTLLLSTEYPTPNSSIPQFLSYLLALPTNPSIRMNWPFQCLLSAFLLPLPQPALEPLQPSGDEDDTDRPKGP